jgi:hypothetical protein
VTSPRLVVWSETIALTCAYVVTIWWTERWTATFAPSRALAIALAFAIVQSAAIVILLVALFSRKWLAVRRAARTAALQQQINATLAEHALGQDQLRPLRSLVKRSRRDVQAEVESMMATMRGDARDRVAAVARELGLDTANDEARVEQMFAGAVSGSLLQRAVAVEQLEPHATRLAPTIARALSSSDVRRVRGTLDMIRAWRRVLPIPALVSLLRHSDPAVRADAIRVLPYAGEGSTAAAIEAGMRDDSPVVRVAAAETAARLGIESVIPMLLENIRHDDRDVALASAFAIAGMTGGGAQLQQLVESSDRGAAGVAFEALEKAALGRLSIT